MKMFSLEWKKQAGIKFAVVFLTVFLCTLGFFGFWSQKFAGNRNQFNDIFAQQAQMNIERLQSSGKDADTQMLKQAMKIEQDFLAAYTSGDDRAIMAAIQQDAQYRLDSGNIESGTQKDEVRETLEICAILTEKGIGAYRDPRLTNHPLNDFKDGASAATRFLQNYMLFLLPVVVALLCADSVSAEMHTGSIKLLSGFPCSRLALLRRKYITGIILSLMVILAGFLGAFWGGSLFLGTGDIRYPVKAQESFFTLGKEIFVPEWQIWLRAGIVIFCAVLFFTALALLISVLLKSSVLALLFGVVVAAGGTLLNRQAVLAAKRTVTLARYLPFDMADSYAAAIGKIQHTMIEIGTDASGLLSTGDTQQQLIIKNTFPGILSCGILLLCAAVCFGAAGVIFRRKDVA